MYDVYMNMGLRCFLELGSWKRLAANIGLSIASLHYVLQETQNPDYLANARRRQFCSKAHKGRAQHSHWLQVPSSFFPEFIPVPLPSQPSFPFISKKGLYVYSTFCMWKITFTFPLSFLTVSVQNLFLSWFPGLRWLHVSSASFWLGACLSKPSHFGVAFCGLWAIV